MKLYSVYKDGLDRAWYDSSNVKYSECIDKEGELKIVKVVFNGGRTYEYKGVDVNDYLKFREATSQGSAFNQFLKKYEFEKLDNSDLQLLEEEYHNLTTPGFVVEVKDGTTISVTKQPEGISHDFKVGAEHIYDVVGAVKDIFREFNMLGL